MKDLLPGWSNIVFTQLISYGVQLGHSVVNSLSFCAWMIRGKRQSIFLIDLFKFNYMLRAGLYMLEAAVRSRKPVWFINLDKTSSLFVKFPALDCGEYWVTENWIKGMISNYFVIKKSFLKNVNRPFAVWNRKFFLKNSNFSYWGFTRYTWPRFVFVSNVLRSYGPCHEAHRLGIPALGVVDTNTPHNLVSIALPGNDESASALVFYNSFISTFVLYAKYSFVHSWYMGCLHENTFSFEHWWQNRSANVNRKIKPSSLVVNFDQLRYMIGGFESQFVQDSWQTRRLENLKYIYSRKNLVLPFVSLKFFYNKKVKLLKALTKTWVLSSFFLKFLRPSLRKMLIARRNKKYQSRYSLTKQKNIYYFLMPFRLSERLFYKKVSRRLSKIKIATKAKYFFYKFYSLTALFSLFRSVPLFTQRMNKKIDFKSFYHRGGIRFPNYSYQSFLAPSSYKRVYLRYAKRNRYSNSKGGEDLRTKTVYPTKGLRKNIFQFSKGWFKSLFLLRYCSSLGMPINRFSHLSSRARSIFILKDSLFVSNTLMKDTSIQSIISAKNNLYFSRKQNLNLYEHWSFASSRLFLRRKWFLRGKIRFSYPLKKSFFNYYNSLQQMYGRKLLSNSINMGYNKKKLKQIYYGYA